MGMIVKEETKRAIEKIANLLPAERLAADEPMSRHTSFRIGGPAACLAVVSNEEELAAVIRIVKEECAEYMLIGNGSNLLISDEGYPGIAIKLGGEFDSICVDDRDDTLVHVGAAKLMSATSAFLTDHGLSGFEFASGIPGSIGGAVFMNAGAYGGEIKDIAETVRVMTLDKCELLNMTNEDMDFGYRNSRAQAGDIVILSAAFRLSKDEPTEIAARVSELAAKRNSKQPVNFPSAGSTFKRPVGGYAAALIEEAGLKGYRVGGACVSEKHSGFVINEGGATCEDVLAVMRHVRETVSEKSGIMLEPEVRLINCSL